MFSSSDKTRGRRKTSVLIVEDNIPLASCLEMLLEAHGFETSRTVDGPGGLQSIKLMDFDVILCDLLMPGLSGDQLHLAIRQLKPHLCDRFIFMSGHPQNQQPAALVSGADRPILRKPFDLKILMQAIDRVLEAKRQTQVTPAKAQPSLRAAG